MNTKLMKRFLPERGQLYSEISLRSWSCYQEERFYLLPILVTWQPAKQNTEM